LQSNSVDFNDTDTRIVAFYNDIDRILETEEFVSLGKVLGD